MKPQPYNKTTEPKDWNIIEERLFADACVNLQEGELSKAEALYRQILQCHSEHPGALHFLGVIRYREGNIDAAMELIQKALELNPQYAEAHASLGAVLQNQGFLSEAEKCFRQVIEFQRDCVDAHNNLGTLHLRQGRLSEAAESFMEALALKPDYPDANNNLGVVFLHQVRLTEAEKYFRQAIALNPEHADACNNLGVIYLNQGRLTEASDHFRRTITCKPDHADAHNNLGVVCLNQGRLAEAIEFFRQAVLFKPDHVDAYNNLGKALLAQGQLPAAAECYRKLVSIKPDCPDAYNNLGVTLLTQGRMIDAAKCFQKAIALKPDLADAHNNLGAVFLNQGRLTEAEDCLQEALTLEPKHANAHNNLGQVLQQQGRISAAVERFRQVIRLYPNHAEAYRHLVSCYRVQPGGEEIQNIESLLRQGNLNENDQISLGFALGKAYDDIANYDAAFARFERANRLLRIQQAEQRKSLDIDQLTKHVDELIAAYPLKVVCNPFIYGSDTDVPIFIVGMFRSGTSLVEQIISSHSRVCGAGELKNISSIVMSLPSRSGGFRYPDCVGRLDRGTLANLADDYLRTVRGIGGSARYVADKMPNNIWHLGLISLLFPKARIIHCRRDPRDICLSCFFQRFTDEGTYYTTDLADCGRFYLESERLVSHWKSVLRLRILEVDYETLVANQEAESRRMIEFLGLDWESTCLEYYRTQRTVSTASVWQVRQPVYKRSAGKWRRYKKYLKPLLDVLEHGTGS